MESGSWIGKTWDGREVIPNRNPRPTENPVKRGPPDDGKPKSENPKRRPPPTKGRRAPL